jgi:hypothetical protein
MNIDITKTYTTRSGLSVRIYATDGAGMAVHGAYKTEAGWEYAGWTEDGSFYEYGETNDLDLIPVKTWRAWKEGEQPEICMVRWKNGRGVGTVISGEGDLSYLFRQYVHIHEDGTETPCGVEE